MILQYLLLAFIGVFTADFLLFTVDKNELPPFTYWNKKLFQLRLNNSKWANVLGSCEMCFTEWFNEVVLILFIIYKVGFTWLILPMFILNLGITGIFIAIKNKIKN